jgi:ABC-2 type transport system permease protein
MNNVIVEIQAALWVEFKKALRSRTFWITALAVVWLVLISGLFTYILKDPEQARRLGLLGAKAQFFGGTADWPSFFNLILVLLSVGCLIIFGFIFVWIFGREFSDKTVYDLLSLPVSRSSIVTAKLITAACWSLALTVLVFFLALGIGSLLQLPGWSAAVVWHGLGLLLATGCLTVVLCLPFSLVASVTRGYLPALGCIFAVIILSQVFTQLGNGQFFPWTVPMLFSGAAEALSGKAAEPLGAVSYILVGVVAAVSIVVTAFWWRNADQT